MREPCSSLHVGTWPLPAGVTVIVLKLSRSGTSRFGHFYIETIRGASFGP